MTILMLKNGGKTLVTSNWTAGEGLDESVVISIGEVALIFALKIGMKDFLTRVANHGRLCDLRDFCQ